MMEAPAPAKNALDMLAHEAEGKPAHRPGPSER
jgi:hypothetical protein